MFHPPLSRSPLARWPLAHNPGHFHVSKLSKSHPAGLVFAAHGSFWHCLVPGP